MPKVVVTDAKGLHQVTGTGVEGLEAIKFGTSTTLSVGQANYDADAISIPANALITDLGYIALTALDVTTSGTLTFSFGTAAGGAELVAATQLNQTAADIAIGVTQSLQLGNLPHASGAAIPYKAGAAYFSSSARDIHMRVTVAGANLTTASRVVPFVKYCILPVASR